MIELFIETSSMKDNHTLIKKNVSNYEIHTSNKNLKLINQSHTYKMKFNS